MPKARVFGGEEVDYVEVHDEPIHRQQFSNDYCRIYVAGFRPGETSLWHRHSENTLYVCVHHSCSALNRPSDKEPFMHHASVGDLWWALSRNAPYVHQVSFPIENVHNSHFFAMEFLRQAPLLAHRPFEHPCYQLRQEDSRPGIARVYDLKLDPKEPTGHHVLNFCGIILCLESFDETALEAANASDPFHDGVLSRPGGYKWFDGPIEVDVRNTSDCLYLALVVEWIGKSEPVDGISKL